MRMCGLHKSAGGTSAPCAAPANTHFSKPTGVLGNLAGVAPATAVFMAVYEPIKQEVTKRVPSDHAFLGPLIAGAASGLAASLIRVPTEVVKQRMQSGALFESFWCGVRLSVVCT